MAEIDNLDIRVVSNADAATSALSRLASSANSFRGAARGAARAADDLGRVVREDTREFSAAHEESGNAERSVRNFGNAAQSAGRAASKGVAGITGFWNALKRVAYYRFIRSIIKNITAAFGEGIKNLYHWSSGINGTFAKSMDKIATSTQYLKNSLGTLLAPLINTLAPVLDRIVDRIVDAINWVNRLIAALSGAKTYTVAKKVAAKWDDASKSVKNNAKSAADSIKRTLLGFDEINKLDKPNSSSGGGYGSSGSTKDYSNMFETKAVGENWTNAATKIKSVVKTVWQSIQGFGEGVKTLIANLTTAFTFFRGVFSGLDTCIRQFASGVTAVLSPVATLITGMWQGLQSAFSSIGAGVKSMWDGLVIAASSTAEWIKSHFGGAWTLISAWTSEKWTSIKTVVGGIWDGLKTAASTTGEWIKTGFVNEWNIISAWTSSKWTSIKNTALDIWGKLKVGASDMAEWVGEKVSGAWSSISNWTSQKWTSIKNIALDIWGQLEVGASGMAEWIKTHVTDAWNNISAWTSSKWTSIKNTALDVWGTLKTGASDMAEWVKTGVTDAWSDISAWTASKWTSIKTTAVSLWNKMKVGASDMSEWVKTKVKSAWNNVSNWTSTKWTSVKNTAVSIWNDLKVGASDMGEWVSSRVSTAWSNVSNWTSSKWMNIKGTASNIWSNMKSNAALTFSSISEDVSAKWGNIKTSLSGFVGWLNSGFGNLWRTAWDNAVSAFGTIFAKIKDYAKSPINSVITFINGLISKVENAINAIRKGLSNAIKIDIPSKVLFSAFGQTVRTPAIYWKPLNLSDVSFSRIKYLAEGGILNAATMLTPNVMAGEAGREAVLPLESHTEWMDMVADRVASRMGGAREVALLQSILEVLRAVNEKPFTTEVTTSDIQRAMNRKNVRSGMTVMPVSNG